MNILWKVLMKNWIKNIKKAIKQQLKVLDNYKLDQNNQHHIVLYLKLLLKQNHKF